MSGGTVEPSEAKAADPGRTRVRLRTFDPNVVLTIQLSIYAPGRFMWGLSTPARARDIVFGESAEAPHWRFGVLWIEGVAFEIHREDREAAFAYMRGFGVEPEEPNREWVQSVPGGVDVLLPLRPEDLP